jgi:hypothetical protein
MATLTDTLTAKLKTAFTRMNIERPADKLRDADGTYVVADLQMLAQQYEELAATSGSAAVVSPLLKVTVSAWTPRRVGGNDR